ncbi:hypothetical protein LQW54_001969 [Pestalotiopsis sp. IQ-011]
MAFQKDHPLTKTIKQKWEYFKLLVKLGYKEIEVSTPAASTIEYEFTRQLIETAGAVPDDFWLQVLCPCRQDLIERTVECLRGAKKVIVSLYHASSEVMLSTVFGVSQQDVYDRVVEGVTYFRSITKDEPSQQGTRWNLMFSPEHFSDSDTAYCARLCEDAKSAWGPTLEDPIILTLPATVERSTPNVYADQVELFSRLISERDKVCVSLHVHNDRGCAVAAAELGQMAGAQRVEGCLFGNGERAGNVDLITLALNLQSQGVDPGVDFSDITSVRSFVENIIGIKVHPRSPYAGELIFTAYSGAHQDAINKGLARFKLQSLADDDQRPFWQVPYLCIDPANLGLSRDDIIRLNSQSGKGGVAWTLEHELHVKIPKGLQLQFSKTVKDASVATGGTISPPDVLKLFLERYFVSKDDPRILCARVTGPAEVGEVNGHNMIRTNETTNGVHASSMLVDMHTETFKTVDASVVIRGKEQVFRGQGSTVTGALSDALAKNLAGSSLAFHAWKSDTNDKPEGSEAMWFVECNSATSTQSSWGVRMARLGCDDDTQELSAALSAALDLIKGDESILLWMA